MSPPLTVSLRPIDSLTPQEQAQWNAWAAQDPDMGSPFLRAEFALLAGPVCPGAGLAVYRRGEAVVGYLPFQKRGGTVQPLGAPMNDYHGVIGPIGLRPSLDEAAQCLGGDCLAVTAWVGEAEGLCDVPSHRAVIPTDQAYDDWYAGRRGTHGKYFKDKERARRSLAAEFGPVEVEVGLRDPALLDELVALKRAQYIRSGLHDIFACGWTVDLLKALLASPYPDFGAQLCVLRAGGQVCAVEYSLAGGTCFHFWFPAYYPVASRCSPGILLTLDTIRLMSACGFTDFDYGSGSEGYKRYFCDTVQMVGEGRVRPSGVPAAARLGTGALVRMAGRQRAQGLADRIRRRWNVIEACEVTLPGRLAGIAAASRSALKKRA